MIINQSTRVKQNVLNYFVRDLNLDDTDMTIIILDGDCIGQGSCVKSGQVITIVLGGDATIHTLAHELKHAEQHASGLSEYMKLERELTPYKDRWHELEAREYARAYKGKRL